MVLKPAVIAAIEDLRVGFPDAKVQVVEDGQGGAHVTLESVALDPTVFKQADTWVGFLLSFQLPHADVYPIHVRPDLARQDGKPLTGDGVNPGNKFVERPSIMLSRRSNKRDAQFDSPRLKVLRVLDWLTNRWGKS